MESMGSASLLRPSVPLAAFLVAAALVHVGCAPEPAAGPFEVEAALIDFGVVHEGRVLAHEWRLAVRTPSRVTAAKTDCGCTLAELERMQSGGLAPYELGAPLAPGEGLVVRARYDTRGRRGPSARAVTLVLAEGAPVALTLQADVRPWLVFEPPDLEFARVREGEGASRGFQVRAESGEPFGLRATRRALPEWVALELTPVEPASDGRARLWNGIARLLPSVPRGTFSYPIELESDVRIDAREPDGRRHTVAPPWTVQVVGAVMLSAATLEFGLLDGRETVARSLRLESLEPGFVPDHVSARLQALHPDEPFLLERTARIHTRLVDGACEIELTLAGLDPALQGSFLARLVVETGHPELPRLEALVRGARVPSGGG
jgi:hypothetical protein